MKKWVRIGIAIISGFALITVVVTGALGSAPPVPINLGKVTMAVSSRFGPSYDWHCQLQSDQNRIVICTSQPNGYYTARYHVRNDGTLVLETYVPPPS